MKSLKDDYRTRSQDPLEKNTLVLKLERSQQDVGQLRNKLNSYICEPKTYSLFERMEALKNGLDTLSNTNREIILSVRQRKKHTVDFVDRVRQQFIAFNELQRGVEEYMQGLRSY
ncbi:hypothetical protein [Ulvibacterium marinum]|uniref:Uncharacterized protein n=1 Tax=Ulvibacterium marinum TaxID=2419782 RepID=A0A3B0C4R9_9FLAO|nr:hypothetical protein [Ulvibacterium marinum]RKN81215.1 hypothetical protein D7Z94_09750 [Ulvibacterium marinum]